MNRARVVIRQSSIVLALLLSLLGPLAPEPSCAVVSRSQSVPSAYAIILFHEVTGSGSAGFRSAAQPPDRRLTGLTHDLTGPTRVDLPPTNWLSRTVHVTPGSNLLHWHPGGHAGTGLATGIPRLAPAHASAGLPAPTIVHAPDWYSGSLDLAVPERAGVGMAPAGRCAPGPEIPPPVLAVARV